MIQTVRRHADNTNRKETMKTPNILEVLREYIADGGSREVYSDALKELAALKKAAEHGGQAAAKIGQVALPTATNA